MDRSMRAGFTAVLFGLIVATGEFVRSQGAAPPPVFTLSAEMWLIVAGALVTLGANLEQLRRVRADARQVKQDLEKMNTVHAEATRRNDHANAQIGDRLGRIEGTLSVLVTRRRQDRGHVDTEGV